MEDINCRTRIIIGEDGIDKLNKSHIAIFGVGGVGGYVAEALARIGVGRIDLIDKDKVNKSNINRQIIALNSTIGRSKVEAMKERINDINEACIVNGFEMFYLPETEDQFDFSQYDYIVDAVDTVTSKISLVVKAKENNVPIISSMGAGNKLDPTAFQVADIYETSVCPLAKVMRRELKERDINNLKVVYSKEKPIKPKEVVDGRTIGSVSFVPSAVGLIIASEVTKDIIGV